MDGIFDISTFTEPRFHNLSVVSPSLGMIVGLIHVGTSAGVFAMYDLNCAGAKEFKVYIPIDTDFKGWGGNWWPLSSVLRSFPDSEIARHFSGVEVHPENYIWIYPNLEPYATEDWFRELVDVTPDLKLGGSK